MLIPSVSREYMLGDIGVAATRDAGDAEAFGDTGSLCVL